MVILFSGLAAIVLNNTVEGYSAMFGITLVVAALISVLHIFVYFDKQMNEKFLMELLLDGFSGVIIFTFNNSNEDFFLTVFAFWAFVNGMFYLTSGLIDKNNKSYLALYSLLGIALMSLGFMPLHINEDSYGSVVYVIGFTLVLYSASNLYLLFKRKIDVY